MFKQYKLKNYKFILIALVVILNTIGVALVGSASPGDQKKQIIGMVSGIIIMLLVSYIDYNFILRFSWLIYLGVDEKTAVEDACKIEHVLSAQSFQAIKKHITQGNELPADMKEDE